MYQTERQYVLDAKRYEATSSNINNISVGDYLVQSTSVYKIDKIHSQDKNRGVAMVHLVGISRFIFATNHTLITDSSIDIVYKRDAFPPKLKSIYDEVK